MSTNKFGSHIQKKQHARLKKIEEKLNLLKGEARFQLLLKDSNTIDAGKRRIVNIATGIAGGDVPSKFYVDTLAVYYTDLKNWPGNWINGNRKRLVNFAEPVDDRDLTTRGFVENTALCIPKNKLGEIIHNKYDAKCRTISNVSDPKEEQDVVTLAYVQKNFLAKDGRNKGSDSS